MKSNKQKIIVFDFMRTLYDPDLDSLIKDTENTLNLLSMDNILFLISRKEGQRQELLKELGVITFFEKIFLVDEKSISKFASLLKKYNPEDIYIIGDRIYDEINIGNSLGYKTIWFQNGKFANQLPKEENQKPWKTIHSLGEIFEII